jgi:hypothetical protein
MERIFGLMWTNLFKKNVVLNCYTSNKSAYDLFSINHSKNFIPEWWKRVPKAYRYGDNFYDAPTIKSCPGFIELYKKGIMVPLWSDLEIQSNVDGYNYQFADQESSIEYNHPDAVGPIVNNMDVHSIKLTSPWLFECSHDVDWLFVSPMWNTETMEVLTVPGTVKFHHAIRSNINLMIRKGLDHNISLSAGTPIVQMVPLTDRNIEVRSHYISRAEFQEREVSVRPYFFGGYKKVSELKEKQQKKCPFHH